MARPPRIHWALVSLKPLWVRLWIWPEPSVRTTPMSRVARPGTAQVKRIHSPSGLQSNGPPLKRCSSVRRVTTSPDARSRTRRVWRSSMKASRVPSGEGRGWEFCRSFTTTGRSSRRVELKR